MLADAGASAVIVGHSERRADHGETDALVRQKAEAAWRAGLVAIVCIGETQDERDAGADPRMCGGQLAGSLPDGAHSGQSGGGLRAGLGDRHRPDPDRRRMSSKFIGLSASQLTERFSGEGAGSASSMAAR